MNSFHLTIARIGENLFDGEATSAVVPGSSGVCTILARHEPFVSTLVPGTIFVKTPEGEKHSFIIEHDGIAEVSHNQATILL